MTYIYKTLFQRKNDKSYKNNTDFENKEHF